MKIGIDLGGTKTEAILIDNDGKEIFKFISDLVEDSQNILLVIDDEKPELEEIMNTYSDREYLT